MTVATTQTYAPTIDVIIKQAMVVTGLMNTAHSISHPRWAADAQSCRQHLEDVLDALPARGSILREVRFTEQTLTADDYTYTLDQSIIDVLGNAMYIPASETDTAKASGEQLVTQMSMSEWNQQSDKSSTGTPQRFFAYRAGPVIELRLWPIPDEAGTLRFQAHRRSADNQDGSKTPDLEPYWRTYLKLAVGALFAADNGLDAKSDSLEMKAERALRFALNKGQSRIAPVIAVSHKTGWSR